MWREELRYIAKRLGAMVFMLLLVTFVVFVALENTPGDPAELILGQNASAEAIENVRSDLGLDDPLVTQYVRFLGDMVTGDLGESFRNKVPVADEIVRTGKVSAVLASSGLGIAVLIGVGVGIVSAARPNSWIDNLLRITVLAGVSVPVFWMGLMLISFVSVKLGWLPSFGWGTPKQVVLPALTLATFPLAVIARMTRSSMLEALGSEHIRTLRANGVPERVIIMKYAFKQALAPIATVIGLQFGALIAGAILTETVFGIPGIGRLTVQSIIGRDYPFVRAAVVFTTIAYVSVNLLVDLAYRWIDPRQRRTA
ncbi:MAG: ABC transporter permease [Actinobacteria bacterium]|nr:ABC transporter permease [Actinomycetota bacterium]